MSVRLSQQLEQVQNDLAHKLSEAERIADCLVELGIRLQREPWKWSLGWMEDAFPSPIRFRPSRMKLLMRSIAIVWNGC